MPDTPETPEELLRDKLTALVDGALDRMISSSNVDPSFLSLIAGATARLAALDARPRGSR